MAEADGFSLLYRGLMVVLGYVEFFLPLGLLGHRTLFGWVTMQADVRFIEHLGAGGLLELAAPICAGLALVIVTWLLASAFVGTLRWVFQRDR